MPIRNKILPYVLRVMRGDIRIDQLKAFARNRLATKGQIVSGPPTHISFFVTSRCNSRCDMCPTHTNKMPDTYVHRHRPAPDMSLKLLKHVLDLYPNVIRVPLIGVGEPLLNPQLFEMVKECTKRQMIVDTVSNGLILDSYLTEIVKSGIDLLCVSVNSHCAQDFHRMTGNSEAFYDRVLANFAALVRARGKKQAKPRLEASFIVDSQNHSHIGEMIALGESLGADAVLLNSFLGSPYPGFTPEERCLFADDLAVRDSLAKAMSRKYRCDVRWPYLLGRVRANKTVCRWPFSILIVDGAGNVGGCPRALLNLHENGQVFDNDPWNNPFFKDLRRRHLEDDLFWPCKSCVETVGVEPTKVLQ